MAQVRGDGTRPGEAAETGPGRVTGDHGDHPEYVARGSREVRRKRMNDENAPEPGGPRRPCPGDRRADY
ncbi:hypothetical protein GCM10010517_12820 [Streptosporangium fragile]|uniref:Uncharacterized protein n=1 Tax=Streptosporangium fragile TaxID=46186 RepID=A0ABN3VUW1_9ACTN